MSVLDKPIEPLTEAECDAALARQAASFPTLSRDGVKFPFEGAGGYFLEWSRLQTPEHLLGWVKHLSAKPWMTGLRTASFVEAVCKYRGWSWCLPA